MTEKVWSDVVMMWEEKIPGEGGCRLLEKKKSVCSTEGDVVQETSVKT